MDSNTRMRPYNGQPHTPTGERGKEEVKGLTIRDVLDCFAKSLIGTAGKHSILELPQKEWKELWINTGNVDEYGDGVFEPTDEMLKRINNNEFVGDKADIGLWSWDDMYHIEDDFDPIAVLQNTAVEIEKMMGIYPNNK